MGYVERSSISLKMTIKNFDTIKEQFLLDLQIAMEMKNIPPELVLNWDYKRISIVPGTA